MGGDPANGTLYSSMLKGLRADVPLLPLLGGRPGLQHITTKLHTVVTPQAFPVSPETCPRHAMMLSWSKVELASICAISSAHAPVPVSSLPFLDTKQSHTL